MACSAPSRSALFAENDACKAALRLSSVNAIFWEKALLINLGVVLVGHQFAFFFNLPKTTYLT
jgi:hypothetical protein